MAFKMAHANSSVERHHCLAKRDSAFHRSTHLPVDAQAKTLSCDRADHECRHVHRSTWARTEANAFAGPASRYLLLAFASRPTLVLGDDDGRDPSKSRPISAGSVSGIGPIRIGLVGLMRESTKFH